MCRQLTLATVEERLNVECQRVGITCRSDEKNNKMKNDWRKIYRKTSRVVCGSCIDRGRRRNIEQGIKT